MHTWVIIGLLAGLVSAVLFASAAAGSIVGLMVLFLLSPLPIAIAGLGWGWSAAAVGAVSGAAIIAIATTPRAAVFHLLALGMPAAVLSYFALLNRETVADPAGPPQTEWYPLGRVVAFAALWGGLLATFALLSTATDIEGLTQQLRATIERMFVRPDMPRPANMPKLTPEQLSQMTSLMVVSFAGITATSWFLLGIANLWLGGWVAAKSGRLVRPWPDLSTLALPRSAPLAFAAAIAGTFLPGIGGLVASGFAGALFAAFMLVGLAIVHHVSRGHAARGMIIAGVYASLLLLNPFSGIIIAMLGLAEPLSPLRRTPQPAPGSPYN